MSFNSPERPQKASELSMWPQSPRRKKFPKNGELAFRGLLSPRKHGRDTLAPLPEAGPFGQIAGCGDCSSKHSDRGGKAAEPGGDISSWGVWGRPRGDAAHPHPSNTHSYGEAVAKGAPQPLPLGFRPWSPPSPQVLSHRQKAPGRGGLRPRCQPAGSHLAQRLGEQTHRAGSPGPRDLAQPHQQAGHQAPPMSQIDSGCETSLSRRSPHPAACLSPLPPSRGPLQSTEWNLARRPCPKSVCRTNEQQPGIRVLVCTRTVAHAVVRDV